MYGTRLFSRSHRALFHHRDLAKRLISFIFSGMYNRLPTDVEVCDKMFRTEGLTSLRLTASDFSNTIGLTAQIASAHTRRINEVGISYFGRTHDKGGKRSNGKTA